MQSLALFMSPPTDILRRQHSQQSISRATQSSANDAINFSEAAKRGNLVPLHKSIFSDNLTPITAYRCLVKEDETDTPSFLFESVEHGVEASTLGRYSVLGAQPAMEIVARENIVTIMDHREGTLSKELVDDPLMIPRRISESWKPQMTDRLPDTFCGGWIGYFSYDTVRHVQKANLPSSRATQDDINLADMHLGLYVDVIVLDHVEKKAHVIHWVMVDRHPCVESAYSDGVKCLEKLVSKVHDINPPRLPAGYVTSPNHQFSPFIKSKLSSKEYSEAVEKAKEHILAGDVSQIVLSQGFERPTFTAPFEVYRALRVVSPDHCMTYLQARGCILVASSPEVVTCAKKVSGELRHNVTCWDVLRAALPVCTVCGTPKIMAMKVTDMPEMTGRGPCGGGFGSISFNGDMEIAVDSRIMVFPTETQDAEKGKSRRQWIAYLQAGATIGVDTDPESEYRKCQSEVAHVAQAIDLAEPAFIQVHHHHHM